MGKLYQQEVNIRTINPTVQHFGTDIALDVVKQGEIYDIDVVKQSITNILLTIMGERLFNIQFGTNLFSMLFNSVNTYATVYAVKTHIIDKILTFEKRISIYENQSTVIFNPDTNELSVSITFELKATAETAVWENTLVL